MRLAALTSGALSLYAFALYFFRVPYVCEPYEPTDECDRRKLYRVRLYEQKHLRHPLAVVETHCLVSLPGRIKAEGGRMIKYRPYSDQIADIEFFDAYEFPLRNAETCREN